LPGPWKIDGGIRPLARPDGQRHDAAGKGREAEYKMALVTARRTISTAACADWGRAGQETPGQPGSGPSGKTGLGGVPQKYGYKLRLTPRWHPAVQRLGAGGTFRRRLMHDRLLQAVQRPPGPRGIRQISLGPGGKLLLGWPPWPRNSVHVTIQQLSGCIFPRGSGKPAPRGRSVSVRGSER